MSEQTMSRVKMLAMLKERGRMVERYIVGLPGIIPGAPERLAKAMSYSLEGEGKRIRPVLCLSCAALCGLEMELALPFAAAIEMIHTYSLIHDDLPAMDNDDLRRGKPSNHKAFDEATAILAGDGLLTDAFFVMTRTSLPSGTVLAALSEMALAAGSMGMVGGQMLDMIHTGSENVTVEVADEINSRKTGAILTASCVCGAILADASGPQIESLREYGKGLGAAFQISDDILDITGNAAVMGKPVGSDEANGKLTYPAIIGLEAARKLADRHVAKACAAIDDFSGNEKLFLQALAKFTVERAV